MSTWIERESKVYMTAGGRRLKATMVRGSGARLWDDTGKEYLDFMAGWAVTNLGHCHPAITEAIIKQAQTLLITSNDLYTVPQVELAEALVENSCIDRVFFQNSGAEANEAAVKLARKWGKGNRNGAYEIITTLHSFHGRTLSMVSATGKPEGRVPYEPVPAGFVNVEFDDIAAVRNATNVNTVAVMVEPVQGEGGVNVPSPGYLQSLREWCDANNLLLIFDEVQTGFGRLGSLWGYQQSGVEPDVITLAKGLGGGVPIGAVTAKTRADAFTPGDHGTTFGGNPLVCAAALASFRYILDNRVWENAARVGAYFMDKLLGLRDIHGSLIKEVRGSGLLIALEFNQNCAMEVVTNCLGNGLVLNPVSDNAIRFMPPLIITESDADEAVKIVSGVLAEKRAAAPA
ncbi:MAG: aspartate aminotransferase family protein [Dehalococcoidia bacterium]|nr:aspartate aminotransferase family protein [Dehalococcoidia bacterium]